MSRVLQLQAIYKMGHQRFTTQMAIAGVGIAKVEAVPPEVPEYADGFLTRIQLINGTEFAVTQPFEEVAAAWEASMESPNEG